MRNRKVTIGIVIALVFAVVSLGIAFAAFSTTLNITGSASVESSNWNVYFTTDIDNPIDPGSNGVSLNSDDILEFGATAQNVSTLLKSNTFTWSATLKSPEDHLTYFLKIYNAGDYDAKISFSGVTENKSIMDGCYEATLTCTQNGVVTAEASRVCSHITARFFDFFNGNLPSGDFYTFPLDIELDNIGWAQDGSDLPKNPVTVTAAPIVLTATQASSAH